MKCPYCENKDSKVVESRESSDSVRRRRECIRCGLRFTTYETVSRKTIMIVKKDGRMEPFSNEKIEKTGFKPEISSEDGIKELIEGLKIFNTKPYTNLH